MTDLLAKDQHAAGLVELSGFHTIEIEASAYLGAVCIPAIPGCRVESRSLPFIHEGIHQSAEQISCFVRGVLPWPGAFTFVGKERLKIYRVAAIASPADAAPGTVIEGFPDELRVAAGRGAVRIDEIQGASGKRMPIADFLRGRAILPGTVLN